MRVDELIEKLKEKPRECRDAMLTIYRELKGDLRHNASLSLATSGLFLSFVTLIKAYLHEITYGIVLGLGLMLLASITVFKYVKMSRLIRELHGIMCEDDSMDRETIEAVKDSLWLIISVSVLFICAFIILLMP